MPNIVLILHQQKLKTITKININVGQINNHKINTNIKRKLKVLENILVTIQFISQENR